MGKLERLEREFTFEKGQGSFDKSSDPIDFNLHYGVF